MSFAKMVKEELTGLQVSKDEQLAELAAFLQLNTEVSIANQKTTLWFKTNNPTVGRRFLQIVKQLYKVENTLLTKQALNFRKNHQIQIGINEDLERILSEHDILSDEKNTELLTQLPETKQAYLRGAFLASGSVNDPKTAQYHLEIYASNPDQIIFIQKLMNQFDLNAKITQRRKGFIAYLKDVEHIEDFLRYIGASKTVFLYEDIRIKRDLNNSINRIVNCEIANEKKIVAAAYEQIEYIKIIQEHIGAQIDYKMQEVMTLRLEYPEASLNELVELFEKRYQEKITKSGLNHRFLKIKETAKQIMESKHTV